MVTSQQKLKIKKHMRRIKDATDAGKSEEEVKRRVTELYNYLESQGLVIDE